MIKLFIALNTLAKYYRQETTDLEKTPAFQADNITHKNTTTYIMYLYDQTTTKDLLLNNTA